MTEFWELALQNAEYLNNKNSLTKNLTTDFVITYEEGNQFTIEQVRAKSIMSDKK